MKLLKKYILFAFLIENLLMQTYIIRLGEWPFYIMCGIGLALLFSKEFWSRDAFRKCKPLYLLALVYIVYQFTLGFDTLSARSLTYLLAKVTTFVIVIMSVVTNWQFYARKMPMYVTYIVFAVLLYGIITGNDLNSGERLKLGFGNENSTSSIAAICLAGVLFFWNKKHKWIYAIIALVSAYAVLAGGSRNGMFSLAIIMLVWTGLSVKKIVYAGIVLFVMWGAINVLHVNLAGVDRMKDTVEGREGTNRDAEREAAYIMISEKPWTGWGFKSENVGRAASVTEIGAHSGYLEMIKDIGYPFAILWFAILFFSVLPLLKYIKSTDIALRYHIAIVVSHIAAAFFESLYVGVHELSTNIIFYSLAVLTTYQYMSQQQRNVIPQYRAQATIAKQS